MKIYRILFALALLLLGSCIKDDTQRDLLTLNKPVLVNPDKDPYLFIDKYEYIVEAGAELLINPAIEYNDPADLTYEWRIDGKVVSTEKNLRWTLGASIREDRLYGIFSVFSRKSQNADVYSFSVRVYNPYQAGYMILARKNGVVNLHFFQDFLVSGKYVYEFTEDVANVDLHGDGRMIEHWSREANTIMGEMIYLDSNPDNSRSFNGKSFGLDLTLRDEFRGGTYPEGFTAVKDQMNTAAVSYVVGGNNKVYMCPRGVGYYTGYYYEFPMRYEGKEMTITHLCAPERYSSSTAAMYDQTSDKFYGIYTGFISSQTLAVNAGTIKEIPQLSGKAAGKTLVWMKNLKEQTGGKFRILALYKDSATGTKFYLRQMSFTFSGGADIANPIDEYASRFVEVSDINENSVIYVMTTYEPSGATSTFRNILYTNGVDHKTVYKRSRTDVSITDPMEFGVFEKDVVAISSDKAGRTHCNFMFGFADGTLEHYAVVTGSNTSGLNSPLDRETQRLLDGGIESANLGEIMSISFKYGIISNTN